MTIHDGSPKGAEVDSPCPTGLKATSDLRDLLESKHLQEAKRSPFAVMSGSSHHSVPLVSAHSLINLIVVVLTG